MRTAKTKREVVSRVAELEAVAPPVDGVVALRRSLLYAMLNEVKDTDMKEIVRAQMDKAKEGDTKAARLIMDMVSSGRDSAPTHMQQAIVVNGREKESRKAETPFLSDTREQIVHVLAQQGPLHAAKLASVLHAPLPHVLEALNDHHWFEKEANGWHVSAKGRAEVLGK